MYASRNCLGSGTTGLWLTLCLALLVFAFALSVPLSAANAQAINQYTNSADSATNGINDSATSCAAPLTRTFTVGQSFVVTNVTLGVLASHSYRGDLVMNLVSPGGTSIRLTSGSGSVGANNFNVLFDDAAPNSITTYTQNDTAAVGTTVPPYNNSYSPQQPLADFSGQGAMGIWTLQICDQFAQDSGTFFQADLFLTAGPSAYADLSLSQTISTTSPAAGGLVTYTLSLTNAAGSSLAANGITVFAPLPAGVSLASIAGGTYNSASGIWSVGSLGPGQSANLVINVNVTASPGATVAYPAEIASSSAFDFDSTPGNGVITEDDYSSRSFTVSGTRVAGTAPILQCPQGSVLFDWDARAWTSASLSNSYAITGIGSAIFSISNPGTFLSNGTYGGQSPALQSAMTGGNTPAQRSLIQLVDLPSQSALVTTSISLALAVPGLQFTIFDVDHAAGQFSDMVTVTGSYNGAAVTPTLTNGLANYVIGNSAFGDVLSADNQSNGNVVVTFSQPVDTITISYGNHSLAPANPGQQAIAIHDINFCNPYSVLTVEKTSVLISDPVNGTVDPKAIPGAMRSYCIVVANSGSATASDIVAIDPLPAAVTYIAGSLTSGNDCSTTNTIEDDDDTGGDEVDPIGASFANGVITATRNTLIGSSTFAIRFNATVN